MNILLRAALYIIIAIVAFLLIGLLPIPAGFALLRTVLYILVGLALIVGLWQLAR